MRLILYYISQRSISDGIILGTLFALAVSVDMVMKLYHFPMSDAMVMVVVYKRHPPRISASTALGGRVTISVCT